MSPPMEMSRLDPEKSTSKSLASREREGDPSEGRSDAESSTSTLYDTMEPDDKGRSADVEKDAGQKPNGQSAGRVSRTTLTVWMVVNTLATIGIVFTNKAIFNDPSFKQCQAAFASFHFFVTFLTLYVLSRPTFSLFVPQSLRLRTMLPLAIAMCANIILMNLSLATSTITFYQIARILLTPAVALLNFLVYRKSLPRNAVITLLPMCLGVAIISYYEPKPAAASKVVAVGFFSVILALISVSTSAVYTIWVAAYQRRLEVNGFQLLYNQAPIGAVLLLYVIPWTDRFPNLEFVPGNKWGMILLSGAMASMINLSQFFIIIGAGPVSSTVVGHVKTCCIVALGWIYGGRAMTDKTAFGCVLAIGSVFAYSYIMMKSNTPNPTITAANSAAATDLRELRSRAVGDLRSLQPRGFFDQARSSIRGYVDFVHTTFSSRT